MLPVPLSNRVTSSFSQTNLRQALIKCTKCAQYLFRKLTAVYQLEIAPMSFTSWHYYVYCRRSAREGANLKS